MNYELKLTERPSWNGCHMAKTWKACIWTVLRCFTPSPSQWQVHCVLAGQQHPRDHRCQPASTEQTAHGLRECFQTAVWQKRIHPDEPENLYAQLILLESRTGMGIAHKMGMQGNLLQRLLSHKQFNQLGCSTKEVCALKQGREMGLLLLLFIYLRSHPNDK